MQQNVEGRKCDRCRPGTFSLDKDNPKGCTECYCFLRSQTCQQAPYVWTSVSTDKLNIASLLKTNVITPHVD